VFRRREALPTERTIMAGMNEHSAELTIENRMGFHVRPVQRFAGIARLFKAEVEVEMRKGRVPGKSIINLMSLGGRHGDKMKVTARGDDAEQCIKALTVLAEDRFFVEDNIDVHQRPSRHIERLAAMASCFRSDITAVLDDKAADAKDVRALVSLGLRPTDEPRFQMRGEDAEQAQAVLDLLVCSSFYVEDQMVEKGSKTR